MYKNKILYTIIIVSLLLFSTILTTATNSKDNKIITQGTTAKWTVMYERCGDNHISYEMEIFLDDLMKIGSANDFNLIALKDGGNDGDSALYMIEEGSLTNLNEIYGWPDELDMTNPNTLKSFIELVKTNYPADNYALFIMSDGGAGWQGIVHDAQNSSRDYYPLISMPSLSQVLKDVTNNGCDKINVAVFFPCVMGMLEVAYEISPYVDYLVASEENMLEDLDNGPDYTLQHVQSMQDLKNNTDISPEEFATSFIYYYKPCELPLWVLYGHMIFTLKGKVGPLEQKISDILTNFFNNRRNPKFHISTVHTTLSAINLSKMNDVGEAMDNLASTLILNINEKKIINIVREARSNTREFAKFYAKFRSLFTFFTFLPLESLNMETFIDVYDLVQKINDATDNPGLKNSCMNVMNALDDAVIANAAMPDDEAHGLSLYFPSKKIYYNKYIFGSMFEEIEIPYEDISFSQDTLWDEFLKTYLNV